MEDELICPVCKSLFNQPIVLPCRHVVCCKCADILIVKQAENSKNDNLSEKSCQDLASECKFESDQASISSCVTIASESDSGYSGNSDGGSGSNQISSNMNRKFYTLPRKRTKALTDEKKNALEVSLPTLPKSINCLICPVCQKTVFLDDRGTSSLARHKIVENIIKKHQKTLHFDKTRDQNGNFEKVLRCQSCNQNPASTKCTRCKIVHCEYCEHSCGSFTNLERLLFEKNQIDLKGTLRCSKSKSESCQSEINYQMLACTDHPTENSSLYCSTCRIPLCVLCQVERKHVTHDVKAIGSLFKQQKCELSRNMSSLSSKARKVQEAMVMLRSYEEDLEEQADVLKAKLTAECRRITEALEMRKTEMLKEIEREKNVKTKELESLVRQCSAKLQKATGLLEYCVEVVNEDDASAYLQVSEELCDRVSNTAHSWDSNEWTGHKKPTIDLTCEFASALSSIEKLQLAKSEVLPPKPFLYVDSKEPISERTTLSWTLPLKTPFIFKFKLEIDNGCNGPFREIYAGMNNSCTVNGLHPGSLYKARVLALNKAGQASQSNILQMQTVEIPRLPLDVARSEFKFVDNQRLCGGIGNSDHVMLADRGFSEGIHYWEFSIVRFDSGSTPSFGVALSSVDRKGVLGKTSSSWSMQCDLMSNWLQRNDHVARRNNTGLKIGAKVGVLLNLVAEHVGFYINDKHQGSILLAGNRSAITTYYPAVAMERQTEATLNTHPNPPKFLLPFETSAKNSNVTTFKRSLSLNYKAKRPPPPPPLRSYDSSTICRMTRGNPLK